ncbi:MAG TPA: hypothetical protein VHJ17_13865, partial [Thermomonospora sp.]|nr:hypothetical protein [Thermomonospora sp.]
MLPALARAIAGRPGIVLAVTTLLLLPGVLLGGGMAERLRHLGFTDPAAESSRAAALLDRAMPAARPDVVLVVRAGRSVDDPAVAARGRALTDRLAREGSLVAVTSYWTA